MHDTGTTRPQLKGHDVGRAQQKGGAPPTLPADLEASSATAAQQKGGAPPTSPADLEASSATAAPTAAPKWHKLLNHNLLNPHHKVAWAHMDRGERARLVGVCTAVASLLAWIIGVILMLVNTHAAKQEEANLSDAALVAVAVDAGEGGGCPRGQEASSLFGVNVGSLVGGCQDCVRGRFRASPNSTACEGCAPGRHAPESGLTACRPCPAGTKSTAGSSGCEWCPLKFGSFAGASACEPCSLDNTTTAARSGFGCLLCDGGHVMFNGACVPCAQGRFRPSQLPGTDVVVCADVLGAGASLVCRAEAQCASCPAGKTSLGGTGARSCGPCRHEGACLKGGQCAPSWQGRACTDCMPGRFSSRGACLRCPAHPWTMLLLPFLAVALLFWLIKHIRAASTTLANDMSETHDTATKLKLMLKMSAGYSKGVASAFSTQAMHAASTVRASLQSLAARQHTAEGAYTLLAQFSSGMTVLGAMQLSVLTIEMQFEWPGWILSLSDAIGNIVSLDFVMLVAPECLIGAALSHQMRWILMIVLPMFPLLVLWTTILLMTIPAQCSKVLARKKDRICAVALGLFLVIFTLLAQTCLSSFDCVSGVDGGAFMRFNPAVPCKGDQWSAYSLPAVLVILLILGASGVLCAMLVCSRDRLYSDKSFLAAYGTLYTRYDHACYYWEFCILARKLAMVMIVCLLRRWPWAQVGSAAVVLSVSLWAQMKSKPFLNNDLDELEERMLGGACGLIFVGAMSMLGAPVWAVSVLYVAVVLLTATLAANTLRRIWFNTVKLDDQIGELQKQKEQFDKSQRAMAEVAGSPLSAKKVLV